MTDKKPIHFTFAVADLVAVALLFFAMGVDVAGMLVHSRVLVIAAIAVSTPAFALGLATLDRHEDKLLGKHQ